jgi:hypothetical protein
MLDPGVLDRLFNLTYWGEKGVISNTLQLIGNLLAGEEECQLITDSIPIVPRVIELFKQYTCDYDIFYWLIDIIYKLLIHDGLYYINKLSELIVPLIDCKENIYNKKLLYKLFQAYNLLTKHAEVEHIKIILGTNLVVFVYKYINDEDTSFSKIAISIIGNIMASTQNEDTESILKLGYLNTIASVLQKMIDRKDYNSITVITWSIANICAGSKEHIEVILNSNILKLLIDLLDTYCEVKFYIELIYVFQNCMIFGDSKIKSRLTDSIVVDLLDRCLLLAMTDKTNLLLNKLAYECIDTIRTFFYELDLLENKGAYFVFKQKIENKNIPVYIDDYQMHDDKNLSGIANVTIAQTWDVETLYQLGGLKNEREINK